eukprot:120344-Amphidinium_carterae.2
MIGWVPKTTPVLCKKLALSLEKLAWTMPALQTHILRVGRAHLWPTLRCLCDYEAEPAPNQSKPCVKVRRSPIQQKQTQNKDETYSSAISTASQNNYIYGGARCR